MVTAFSPARRTVLLGAAAAVLLSVYVVAWLQLGWLQQGRSDFGNAYVAGEIVRSGQGSHLYDMALQERFHSLAIAPDKEPNLPFLDAPPAAALAVPFTLFDLRTGWRLWSLFQLALLAAAVAIAAAAAPWPTSDLRIRAVAATLGAGGIGTLLLAIQGQWAGLFAFGLAAGYALWRRGHLVSGTASVLIPILAVKPNLALGLTAFVLGWGQRRVLAGALISVLSVVVAALAIGGGQAATGFFHAAAASTQQWPWSSMNGIVGVTASLLGSGSVSIGIGLAGSLIAAALAFPLGRSVRGNGETLGAAFAGASRSPCLPRRICTTTI